jgi:hypothetical protein
VLGDFNTDILGDNNDTSRKGQLIQFISQFSASTTKIRIQLDHIWTNVPGNDSKVRIFEAYWPDYHKSIYIAFNP